MIVSAFGWIPIWFEGTICMPSVFIFSNSNPSCSSVNWKAEIDLISVTLIYAG